MLDVQKIRKDFPILNRKVNGKPLIYFDNAATSQTPQQVIDVIVDYYSNYNANIHRGVHSLSQEATDAYESKNILTQSMLTRSFTLLVQLIVLTSWPMGFLHFLKKEMKF